MIRRGNSKCWKIYILLYFSIICERVSTVIFLDIFTFLSLCWNRFFDFGWFQNLKIFIFFWVVWENKSYFVWKLLFNLQTMHLLARRKSGKRRIIQVSSSPPPPKIIRTADSWFAISYFSCLLFLFSMISSFFEWISLFI